MPNYVATEIWADEKVLKKLLNSEGKVDFNEIIPEPPLDDPMFTAETVSRNGEVVGYGLGGYSPLDWATENWGTKWNAMYQSGSVEEGFLKFETAWTTPGPIIEKLSLMFPEEEIFIASTMEDFIGAAPVMLKVRNDNVIEELAPYLFNHRVREEIAYRLMYGASWIETIEERISENKERLKEGLEPFYLFDDEIEDHEEELALYKKYFAELGVDYKNSKQFFEEVVESEFYENLFSPDGERGFSE